MATTTGSGGTIAPAPTRDGIATAAVWAGEPRGHAGAPTQIPVVHSVSYGYRDLAGWIKAATGSAVGHIYSRNTNPTVSAFEAKVAALEGAQAATSCATGMAAITATLLSLLSPGDTVVSQRDTYGGTSQLFLHLLPRLGIRVILVDTEDDAAYEDVLAEGVTLLYLETPTNPTLKVVDLARLAKAGRDGGALVVVDNTFATPVNQRPLALGADLVIHSATKFLGGHADALGGVVAGRSDLVQRVYEHREITGASLDPHAAYLLLRGMKTLALRVARQSASALEIARFLSAHPQVRAVHYPGLPEHPRHAVACAQMSGFGGVLSFEVQGGADGVAAVLSRLRLAHLAANLGAVETVVGSPATTSHVECTAEERASLGIPEALIRYSVGIEEPADLIADLEQALSGIGARDVAALAAVED